MALDPLIDALDLPGRSREDIAAAPPKVEPPPAQVAKPQPAIGNMIQLHAAELGVAVVLEVSNDNKDRMVFIRPITLPGGKLSKVATTGYLVANVQWYIGEAQFQVSLKPLSLSVARIPVQGARQVTVFVQWVGPASNPSAPVANGVIQVMVGIGDGRTASPDEPWCPEYVPTQADGTIGTLYGTSAGGEKVSGANGKGTLLALRSSIAAMPTGAGATGFWWQFFDAAGVFAGDVPILESKPMLAVGDWWLWSDEECPTIHWATGLWAAASSTPGVYTAVGGGALFGTIDLKQGQ